MKHIRGTLILIVLVLTATSVAAQDWYGLMQASGSVRQQGFTNAGVAYLAPNSQSLNPGTLALVSSERYISLSAYPVRAGWEYFGDGTGFGYYSLTAGLPLPSDQGRARIGVAFAYAYHRFDYQRLVRLSPTGEFLGYADPRDETHNLTLAAACRGMIQAGFGVTAKYFRSIDPVWYTSSTTSSTQFDFGGVLGKTFGNDPSGGRVSSSFKWSITPTVGLSFRNIGADLRFIESAGGDPPLKTMRAGFSLRLKRWLGNILAYSLTPLFEYEKILVYDKSQYYHYAGEIGVAEVAYFRYGKVTANYGSLDQTAWGLTVTTRGLTGLLGGGPAFLQKADFDFSYAKFAEDGRYILGGLRFMEIGATYRF